MYAGKPTPTDASRLKGAGQLPVSGSPRLSPHSKGGEYSLQVSVMDLLAEGKHRAATQWIDFEVVR